MLQSIRKMALVVVSFLYLSLAQAQQSVIWPSPEVEQMYNQAKEYLSRGGIRQAIVLFQQAIQIAPEVMVLHRDLGQALYLAKSYEEAANTIEPIIKSGMADEQSYYIAGTSYIAMGEKKKAKAVLEKGISRYGHSGLLYHELGKYYEAAGDPEYALDSWLQGIEADPGYHMNYYEAAQAYMNTDKLVWTIIYGEVFVNMERQTNRSIEMRKLLLDAYRKLFLTIGTGSVPKYGNSETAVTDTSFEKLVVKTLLQLSPVVSDGITTENLTMLRARFVMDWMSNYTGKYPFSLFAYQDKLMRDGQFDTYSQWLFGQVENAKQYEGWTQFHKDAVPAFEQWTGRNQLRPTAGDFYNDKDIRSIFSKKKSDKRKS